MFSVLVLIHLVFSFKCDSASAVLLFQYSKWFFGEASVFSQREKIINILYIIEKKIPRRWKKRQTVCHQKTNRKERLRTNERIKRKEKGRKKRICSDYLFYKYIINIIYILCYNIYIILISIVSSGRRGRRSEYRIKTETETTETTKPVWKDRKGNHIFLHIHWLPYNSFLLLIKGAPLFTTKFFLLL